MGTEEVEAHARQLAEEPSESHWTLDKRVPIAIVLALVVQGAGAVWWAAAMEGRVAEAQKAIIRLESRDTEMRESRDRLIRLEERMIAATDELKRMNGKLETLVNDRR